MTELRVTVKVTVKGSATNQPPSRRRLVKEFYPTVLITEDTRTCNFRQKDLRKSTFSIKLVYILETE